MNRKLYFYLDYISHNAYLAWTQLPALAEEFDLSITPVPVLFAGLLNANGQLGPAEIPPKVRWMTRDVLRKAKLLDIPINPPASHPFNPLLPLRVTCLEMSDTERWHLIDALFKATWVDSLDVSTSEVVMQVLDSVGLDGKAMAERACSPSAKQQLQTNTAAAIEGEVFGVPSMQVDGQLFWGLDDFGHLRRYLAGDDPLVTTDHASWLKIPSSSQRSR